MNNKKIIQAIKEWLADNIVTDDEISSISDGTHDIVYGRNIITNKECK